MFEVRNETEIWYKAKEMPDWIHYGSAVVAEPIEKEKFAVKRFDLEKGEYLLFQTAKTTFMTIRSMKLKMDTSPFLLKRKNL